MSWEDQLTNIVDRMDRLEADLEAKEEIISRLREDLTVKDERTARLEAEMEEREVELVEVRGEVARLRERMEDSEQTDLQLRQQVEELSARAPSAYQCAWRAHWTADYSTVTYDRLTFDWMSGGQTDNVTGGMDIKTGVFTVGPGFSGVWSVSYSIQVGRV